MIFDGIDLDNVYFQQDGATCHTSHETIALLREKFPDRVISRRSDHNWPPRSCNLTPCDFFLWGHVKDNRGHRAATLRFGYGKFHEKDMVL